MKNNSIHTFSELYISEQMGNEAGGCVLNKLVSHLPDVFAENQGCVLQAPLQRLGTYGP